MDSQMTDQLPRERSESGGGAVKPSGEDKKRFFIAVQCKTEEPGEKNLKIIYAVPRTRLRRILTTIPPELGQPLYDDYSVWVQVPLGADEKRMIYDCEGDFTVWLQLDSKARLEDYWSLLNTSITTHEDAMVAVSNGTITTLYVGPPPSVPVPTPAPTQEEEEETEEIQEQPTSPEPSSGSSGCNRKRRVPPVDYSGMHSKRFKSLTSMK
jgi:hypothetical protein